LNPGAIQLELLKLLPGTRLDRERARWRLVAAPEPPYEVLQTATMSAGDVDTARKLSNLLDWFYNVSELREPILLAARMLPRFWKNLLAAGEHREGSPYAPSLENRFRWLDEMFRGKNAALMRALHYAWLKHGFSAQHGICPVQVWKGPVPAEAVLIEGNAAESGSRRFVAQLAHPTLFVYGRERRAAAIYQLPT